MANQEPNPKRNRIYNNPKRSKRLVQSKASKVLDVFRKSDKKGNDKIGR